jgi:hypothetical protein
VREAQGGAGWELLHPRCALDRREDLDEVRTMIDAGEVDIAIDELRWLLDGCSDCIEAHGMLGELALSADQDPQLARGHFGYAYQLGLTALRRANMPTPVPYRVPANQAFFEAGKGLAYCLTQLEKPEMAREVLDLLLACDPTDPLGFTGMRAGLGCGEHASREDA